MLDTVRWVAICVTLLLTPVTISAINHNDIKVSKQAAIQIEANNNAVKEMDARLKKILRMAIAQERKIENSGLSDGDLVELNMVLKLDPGASHAEHKGASRRNN